ncbi:hypothetical protein F4803DRAFT_526829 [Xylaria telfairii]|nr:hypothetical protein F4803DRAFT_526829 [Xylaria telfairii]
MKPGVAGNALRKGLYTKSNDETEDTRLSKNRPAWVRGAMKALGFNANRNTSDGGRKPEDIERSSTSDLGRTPAVGLSQTFADSAAKEQTLLSRPALWSTLSEGGAVDEARLPPTTNRPVSVSIEHRNRVASLLNRFGEYLETPAPDRFNSSVFQEGKEIFPEIPGERERVPDFEAIQDWYKSVHLQEDNGKIMHSLSRVGSSASMCPLEEGNSNRGRSTLGVRGRSESLVDFSRTRNSVHHEHSVPDKISPTRPHKVTSPPTARPLAAHSQPPLFSRHTDLFKPRFFY